MEYKGPIVALVDDDKIFQLTASRMLQAVQPATQILQFGNGEEALHFLQQNAADSKNLPDFIFLDINMPFVDGWMFLQDYARVKKSLRKQLIIYMTSSSIDPRDVDRAKRNADIQGYVIKPLTKEKFRELLDKPASFRSSDDIQGVL